MYSNNKLIITLHLLLHTLNYNIILTSVYKLITIFKLNLSYKYKSYFIVKTSYNTFNNIISNIRLLN